MASPGLAVDVRVRRLLVHQAAGFAESGMAVSVSYDLTPDTPLGLTARVSPAWGGDAMSGAEARWGQETMGGMNDPLLADAGGARLDTEVGYGLPIGRRFVGTPRVGVRTSEYGRDYRLGYGVEVLEQGPLRLQLGIEAERRVNPVFGLLGDASGGADQVLIRASQHRVVAIEHRCAQLHGPAHLRRAGPFPLLAPVAEPNTGARAEASGGPGPSSSTAIGSEVRVKRCGSGQSARTPLMGPQRVSVAATIRTPASCCPPTIRTRRYGRGGPGRRKPSRSARPMVEGVVRIKGSYWPSPTEQPTCRHRFKTRRQSGPGTSESPSRRSCP